MNKLNFASTPLALGVCCTLAAGCAGSMASAPHGRAAGEWFVTLPSGGNLPRGLAYGSGGQSLPEARVSEPSAPQLAQAAPARPQKRVPHRRSQVAPPPPAAVPLPSAEPQPLPAAPASAPAAPTRPQTELALAETRVADYRAREASSQSQQAFRGGDAIVIGAGTLVVVLLVVLLVLLLV